MTPDIIPEMINRFQKALEAEELLKQVYLEVGPYNEPPPGKRLTAVSQELSSKLNKFFKFDDSE